MPTWFVLSVAAAYGVVLGSFLNVVIYRLPRGMSLLRPRSHCPACATPVRWYDNVPVLSFVALGGRCRSCRAVIPLRYPLVELASAALVTAAVARLGLTLVGLEAVVLAMLLLPLAVIDLEHHLLPDLLTLPGIVLGLGFSAFGGLVALREAALGAALGAALPWLVIVVYRALRGVEGMGLGDVKLLAMIGAHLGWLGMLLTLCLGACAGAAVGVALILTGRGRSDTELPFGTFLAAAGLIVLFFADALLRTLGWVAT